MKIYIRHIRTAGYCRKEGVKPFFDAQNWDWADFLANGIDAEIVQKTNDAMALKIVDIAQAEEDERRKETDSRV